MNSTKSLSDITTRAQLPYSWSSSAVPWLFKGTRPMKYIPLTKGQFAIVDDADYDWLNQWKWQAHLAPNTQSFYAVRTEYLPDRKKQRISMHRQILGLEQGDNRQGDHIYHNTLDNRRSQLRIVTKQQNNFNLKRTRGYFYNKKRGKYLAQISINNKVVYLGMYDTAREARAAYLEAKKKYHSFEEDGICLERTQLIYQQSRFRRQSARGYYWNKEHGRYQAQIKVDGRNIFLGRYSTPQEARTAYLAARKKYYAIK